MLISDWSKFVTGLAEIYAYKFTFKTRIPEYGLLPDRTLGRSIFSVFYFYAAWLLSHFKDSVSFIYFVPLLLPLLLAPAAYHMGYRGIYLANKVVYKMPKEQKKDRQGKA